MEPFAHVDAACFKSPYRLFKSGDLAGEAPEDCLRRFRIILKNISQGDSGLTERTQQLSAVMLIESACPAAMPGLWIDLYFEEECLRLLKMLCGQDHSQAGLLSAEHVESSQVEVKNAMVMFRHEFELHYLNGMGE